MAQFPSMPFWTDAYLADTKHLTTLEHGAYILLLICMWRTPTKSLPNDPKLLARYSGLSMPQWTRLAPILMRFFEVSGDVITQGRLQDEAAYVEKTSVRQSKKAKSRWLKNKKSNNATALPDACQADAPTPTPTPTPSKKERARPSGRGTRLPDGWKPSDQGREFAEVLLGKDRALIEFDKFCDYWRGLSGGRAIKLDWEGTWRNWCRRSSEYQGKSNGNSKSLVAAADRLIGKLAEFDKPTPDFSGEGSLRSGEGATVVRLLPKG